MKVDAKFDFSKYMEALTIEVFMKDAEGRYIFINNPHPAWGKLGVSIVGKLDSEIQVDQKLAQKCRREDLEVLATGKAKKSISESVVNGQTFYYEILKNPVFDDDGNVMGLCCTAIDITEKVRLERKMTTYYCRDSLTGLYNRNHMKKWRNGENVRYPMAVVVLDCDHLKHINDTYGHKAGDELLEMVAAAIVANMGDNDAAFRTGGDEFAIICNETDEVMVKDFVRRLQRELEGLYLHDITLSASIGYACARSDLKNVNQVIAEADQMMYENKRKYHALKAVHERRWQLDRAVSPL